MREFEFCQGIDVFTYVTHSWLSETDELINPRCRGVDEVIRSIMISVTYTDIQVMKGRLKAPFQGDVITLAP